MRPAVGLPAVLAFGLACGPSEVPRFKKGSPELIEAEVRLPLTPTLRVVLNQPAALELTLTDSRGTRVVTVDAEQRVHEVPLLGLRPRDQVEVHVTALGARGSADARPVRFEVGDLPRRFPELDVLVLDRGLAERGLTVMPVELVSDEEQIAYLIALDGDKEVVWVWRTPIEFGDLRWHPSGALYALGEGSAWELSPQGLALHQWGTDEAEAPEADGFTEVATGSLHHELFPGDGASDFWSLVDRPLDVQDYPCSYAAPATSCGPATLTAPRVVHFDREGTVLHDWALAERIDPFRIGFGSLALPGSNEDWAHANAVIRRPEGGLLVSVRHQGALVALDDQGVVEWILAEPAGWGEAYRHLLLRPVGEGFQWTYHAHGPAYDADGTLWVFDNHNHGTSPYTGSSSSSTRSRVVGYRVDAHNRAVVQVASLRQTATGPLFSRALGNVDVLPDTQNLLGVYGMPTEQDGTPHTELGFGSRAVRLVEWTADGRLASDVRVRSDVADEAKGWRTYRATHAPSLYAAGAETWIEGEP